MNQEDKWIPIGHYTIQVCTEYEKQGCEEPCYRLIPPSMVMADHSNMGCSEENWKDIGIFGEVSP